MLVLGRLGNFEPPYRYCNLAETKEKMFNSKQLIFFTLRLVSKHVDFRSQFFVSTSAFAKSLMKWNNITFFHYFKPVPSISLFVSAAKFKIFTFFNFSPLDVCISFH